MVTFSFHASMRVEEPYEASSVDASGADYKIIGNYVTKQDGQVEYSFALIYDTLRRKTTYWTGTLEGGGKTATFSGKWGYDKDDQPHVFVFKRVPPEVLVGRPHPREFSESRAKALWKYAVTAIGNQVRRRLFGWSYLKERRDIREEYLKLLRKEEHSEVVDDWAYSKVRQDVRKEHRKDQDPEVTKRLSALHHQSTFDDVRCFHVLRDYKEPKIPEHS